MADVWLHPNDTEEEQPRGDGVTDGGTAEHFLCAGDSHSRQGKGAEDYRTFNSSSYIFISIWTPKTRSGHPSKQPLRCSQFDFPLKPVLSLFDKAVTLPLHDYLLPKMATKFTSKFNVLRKEISVMTDIHNKLMNAANDLVN